MHRAWITLAKSSSYDPYLGNDEKADDLVGRTRKDYDEAKAALQQSGPGMIVEDLRVADVAPQRVHALVSRLIRHLENRGARAAALVRKPDRNECPAK